MSEDTEADLLFLLDRHAARVAACGDGRALEHVVDRYSATTAPSAHLPDLLADSEARFCGLTYWLPQGSIDRARSLISHWPTACARVVAVEEVGERYAWSYAGGAVLEVCWLETRGPRQVLAQLYCVEWLVAVGTERLAGLVVPEFRAIATAHGLATPELPDCRLDGSKICTLLGS